MTGQLGTAASTLGGIQLGLLEDNARYFAATDTITYTETNVRTIRPAVFRSDTLTFIETRTRTRILKRSRTDALGFVERRPFEKARLASGTDTLSFTELYGGELHLRSLTETLTLTETVVRKINKNRSVADTLTFTELPASQLQYNRSINDILELSESVPRNLSGVVVVVPGYIGTVATRYNVLSGINYSVVLPTPLFDDSEANGDVLSVFRTTTGRKVISVKRQDMRTLLYQFNLTRQKSIEFRQFMRNEINNQVTLRNWKGEIWVGRIGSNPFELTADGRWGHCTERVAVDLELKAVRIH